MTRVVRRCWPSITCTGKSQQNRCRSDTGDWCRQQLREAAKTARMADEDQHNSFIALLVVVTCPRHNAEVYSSDACCCGSARGGQAVLAPIMALAEVLKALFVYARQLLASRRPAVQLYSYMASCTATGQLYSYVEVYCSANKLTQ